MKVNMKFSSELGSLPRAFAPEDSPINFANWMGFAFPLSLITFFIGWLWLALIFLRCSCFKKMNPEVKKAITASIRNKFRNLGPMSLGEWEVLICFGLLIVLWLFRDPPNIDGWGKLFEKDESSFVSDSTPAIFISVILFILPIKKIDYGPDGSGYVPILKWQTVAHKVPWGVIVLLGGGFALAKAAQLSGLSEYVGEQLERLSSLDDWVMNISICVAVAAFTEVTSNTATAQLLLPVLQNMATGIGIHPLYIMISVTIACSFAFMLPVATPPNAIVFSSGYLNIWEMVVAGIPMNIIAILVLTLAINTWGISMYGLDTLPEIFRSTVAPSLTNMTTTLASNITTTPFANTTMT